MEKYRGYIIEENQFNTLKGKNSKWLFYHSDGDCNSSGHDATKEGCKEQIDEIIDIEVVSVLDSETREVKPKKLIREKIVSKLKEGEFENVTDLKELNKLYAIKVREELAEIQESDHKDIMEFVDLIQVAVCFAEQNGFSHEQIELHANIKYVEKGKFSNLVLNNLNPENLSNKLYFENNNEILELVKREQIAFADYLDKLSPSQKTSVWSKNGEYKGLFNMDNEQLLEKYNYSRSK